MTPAFLGGAFQNGQWRTPPFKALLRQWWRVAYAASQNFQVDVQTMREEEGRLFGNAWLERRVDDRTESAASRSRVRLRLSSWQDGSRTNWQGLEPEPVRHPEVGRSIGAHLYLGYGPLIYDRERRGTGLKAPPCIEAGERAQLSLAYPADLNPTMAKTLWLMSLYGAVGGRSRNGWGSIELDQQQQQVAAANLPLRNWQQALGLDWPHCIGRDERGALIWQTRNATADWKQLMRALAEIKIQLRTQFPFGQAPVSERHWLSYPITDHSVNAWEILRLPNSLRFRVRRSPGDPQNLIGVIFHMPCLPPPSFSPNKEEIIGVWRRVHQFLDQHPQLQRAKE
ncbi:MAG: hypothetical protein ACUVS7_11675 [Bryobacteraceae bacterium]